jgi:hypothetical protein
MPVASARKLTLVDAMILIGAIAIAFVLIREYPNDRAATLLGVYRVFTGVFLTYIFSY